MPDARHTRASNDISRTLGVCCQATSVEDTADQEDLELAVMICKVCKLEKVLQVLVIKIYKSLTNPLANPNPMSIH